MIRPMASHDPAADEDSVFKICVGIPETFSQKLMDAVNDSMSPLYPGYDRVFATYHANGTWRPLPGSKPYIGSIGEIETADEIRVEFAVRRRDLKNVLEVIRKVHPYEEPAIDVIPMYGWKEIILP
jgi:hypothetical protein